MLDGVGSGVLQFRELKSRRTAIGVAILAAAALSANVALAQVVTRVSVDSGGAEGNDESIRPSISDDGRHVAFESTADNLVPGDTNGVQDLFVHDRQTGRTVRVSVSSTGEQGDAKSGRASISADGRFVAFYSDAGNLVDGDSPVFDSVTCPECTGVRDVFVHDRDPDGNGIFDEGNGTTVRASVSSDGLSGNDDSTRPSISGDGNLIAFRSEAGNLVASDTNGVMDVFVRDLLTGVTVRVSESEQGVQGNAKSDRPAISDDGRFVAFFSDSNNLVAGDTNDMRDVLVRDMQTGVITRISIAADGAESDGASSRPAISAEGRYVAFRSEGANLVAGDTNGFEDIFIHDRDHDENGVFDEGNGAIELVSAALIGPANGVSSTPALSEDGRYVAFHSEAGNLVEGDDNESTDVFLWDRLTGTTLRASVCGGGTGGDGDSSRPTISGDGRFVAFHSTAANLTQGDANASEDVFVYDRDASDDGGDCFGVAPSSTPRRGLCGVLGMANLLLMALGVTLMRWRSRGATA